MAPFRYRKGLLRSRTASSVLEFVIIAPLILTILVTTVEISLQLLTTVVLEYSVREASRFGVTGLPYPASMAGKNAPATREAAIAAIISQLGMGIVNGANVSLTMTYYTAFTSTAQAVGLPGAGTGSAVVRYTVVYNQPFMTTFASGIYGASYIKHTATTVVQNEPFPAT